MNPDRSPQRSSMLKMFLFIVVAAVLVFVVTIVGLTLGVGGKGPADEPGGGDVQLLFADPTAQWEETDPAAERKPDQPVYVKEYEWSQPGHYDFFFRNDKDYPVQVGLNKVGCTCSSVEARLAPDDLRQMSAQAWLQKPAVERARLADGSGADWQKLDKDDPQRNRAAQGFAVPARAAGWVRLNWDGEPRRPGQQVDYRRLTATLWTRSPDALGKPIPLDVTALYADPVHVQTRDAELAKQFSNEQDLEQVREGEGRAVDLLFWSSTRDQFQLRPPTGLPYLTAEPLTALSAEQCRQLEQFFKDKPSPVARVVKCAYRLRLQFKGTDLGPFRHELTFENDTDSPVTTVLRGTVRGDVVVQTASGREVERVQLETFQAAVGTSVKLRVVATRDDLPADLQLAADTDKTNSRFQVDEVKPTSGAAGKAWEVMFQVRPGKGGGSFGDPKGSEDCAVYLLLRSSNAEKRIRIPVEGTGVN